jgi:hypothetical protein
LKIALLLTSSISAAAFLNSIDNAGVSQLNAFFTERQEFSEKIHSVDSKNSEEIQRKTKGIFYQLNPQATK